MNGHLCIYICAYKYKRMILGCALHPILFFCRLYKIQNELTNVSQRAFIKMFGIFHIL